MESVGLAANDFEKVDLSALGPSAELPVLREKPNRGPDSSSLRQLSADVDATMRERELA